MKREIREGKEIIVFDTVEEAKWHVHKKLCQDPSNEVLQGILKMFSFKTLTVSEVNYWLTLMPFWDEPCEVKT